MGLLCEYTEVKIEEITKSANDVIYFAKNYGYCLQGSKGYLPTTFNKNKDWKPGTRNLDIGGGKNARNKHKEDFWIQDHPDDAHVRFRADIICAYSGFGDRWILNENRKFIFEGRIHIHILLNYLADIQ